MIQLACDDCRIMYAYTRWKDVPHLCPECKNGPFHDWYQEVNA